MTADEIQAEIERRGTHPQIGPYGEGHDIQQNAWEFAQFAVAMQALDVQSVLEIGTGPHAGLARFMHEYLHWHVTSVDKNRSWEQWDGIEFVVSDERRDFGDRRFDLVIIDGNHSYEFVKGDHEYYGKFATKAVMLHDICGLRGCEDVERYWNEINHNLAFHQIIADSDMRVGIGWYEVAQFIPFAEYGLIQEGFVDHKAIAEQNVKALTSTPASKPKRTRAPKSQQKTSTRKKAAK